MITIRFDRGTLVFDSEEDWGERFPGCRYDRRVGKWRLPAMSYASFLLYLIENGIEYRDLVRSYREREFRLVFTQRVRSYQSEALQAWLKARAGYIVLPTGSGKSYLAILAISKVGRDTCIVVPTLDLMVQWGRLVESYFGIEPGFLGGGSYEVREITVATYDSACVHLERLGNRFGMVVFDECHHLPAQMYSFAARFAIAPFRLGLSATPERSDGKELLLDELIGPCVYRRGIHQLRGRTLSEYEVVRVYVSLTAQEKEEYEYYRGIYLDFLRSHGIYFKRRSDWDRFIRLSSKSSGGRRAFEAYLRQRRIVQASRAKLEALEGLLRQHPQARTIIFTNDNATVYEISKRFFIPALTHQTRVRERKWILENFGSGVYDCIVTSKVLNEGVDIPEANVGIVLSGSGSVREHVQRLGRLLRKRENKLAVLYEIVAEDTSEEYVSSRRRKHDAYR